MGVDLREGQTGQVVSTPRRQVMMRFWPLAVFFVLWAACVGSGRFLVVDEPRQADVILVLAGETEMRPARALQLAAQGYAGRVIVNVPDWSRIYDRSELDLAREWAKAQGASVSICPTHGLSTKDEARDTGRCLEEAHAHSVLIVTSDFHTRRALSTLRRELPGYDFGVSAAYDPREFGVNWWRHRQWTKTNFYEWNRLLWWELVDRWF
jgi:uncharacterized SAM-binding protein YcdF (DUF218 family)